MANTEKTEANGATACECSKFEAYIAEQHTDENLASGNYDIFSTGCVQTTKREFAPGHDAKLKSFLITHGAQGHEIRYGSLVTTAEDVAKRYTFGYMILDGIAKAKEKLAAKAERAAARAAKKTAPKPAKVVADETTHDGNAARKEREAKALSLAEIVKAEEAAHAEAVKRNQPEPEWDDADVKTTDAPILEDEAAMNTLARESREAAGLVKAKVGRWEHEGYVNEDGSFTYAKRSGGTKTVAQGKYNLI